MVLKQALQEKKKISYIYDLLKFKYEFKRDNPDYFDPDGLAIFVGPQGSGKSMCAVNYVYKLKKYYPQSIIVTNIDLQDYPIDNYSVFRFKNADDLKKYKNGKKGVIFLIDEIQLYFNSLDSKNINMDVMTQISQQRKQRIHIVATSQVFGRIAKPLREQFSTVLLCKCYFGFIQRNMMINRDSISEENSTGTNLVGDVVCSFWSFRNPDWFNRYDTYAVIENDEIKAGTDRQNIYKVEPNYFLKEVVKDAT